VFDSEDITPIYREPKKIEANPYGPAIKSIIDFEGQGFSYHTFEAIGKSVLFPMSHWRRMFPSGGPKPFELMIKRGGVAGVMCKEEGLTLTYELSKMRLPKERKIDYDRLFKEAQNTKEMIKDDD